MNKLQFFKSLKTIENTELYSLRSFAEAAKQIDSKLTYRTIRARLRSPKLAHLFTTVGKDIGFEPRALVVVVSIALKDAMQVIDVTATGAASMAVDAANSTLKQCLLETRALSSGSAVIANNVHTFPLRHLIPATNNMAQVNNAAVKLSSKTEPTEPNEAEAAEVENKEQIEAQAVKSLHPVTAAYSADKQTKAMIEERVDFVSWQPYMLEGRLLATTNGLVRADNIITNMVMFYIANELDLVEAKHAVLKSEQFKRWTGCVATEFVAISASSLPNFTAALVHELEGKGKRINYVALTTFMQEVLTAATCCITGEYYRLSTNEVIDACTNFSVQGCSPMALTRRDELVNKFMVQWEDGRKLFPNDVKDLEQCLDLIESTVNAHEVEEEVAKEAEHGVEWSASSGDFGQVPYEEYIDFSIDPREEARLERQMGISDEDKDMGFVYDPEHGAFPFNLVDDNGEPIAHLPGQELNVPSTEQATA